MPVTRLYLLCLADGRPQYQIAAALGVPPPRLSVWASGKEPIPTKFVYRACEVFRCNPIDLVGFAEDAEWSI